jgi:hypothetical protein
MMPERWWTLHRTHLVDADDYTRLCSEDHAVKVHGNVVWFDNVDDANTVADELSKRAMKKWCEKFDKYDEIHDGLLGITYVPVMHERITDNGRSAINDAIENISKESLDNELWTDTAAMEKYREQLEQEELTRVLVKQLADRIHVDTEAFGNDYYTHDGYIVFTLTDGRTLAVSDDYENDNKIIMDQDENLVQELARDSWGCDDDYDDIGYWMPIIWNRSTEQENDNR